MPGKTAVAGAKDRDTGRIHARVVPDTRQATLQGFVADVAAPGATVYTDEARAYLGMPLRSTGAALRLGRGSNGGLCLRRLGLELAAGGVKRPFEHWRAVAAPDVKPGPNHFVASVTDGAGFP